MADRPKNIAASVKDRLLAMAREQGRVFDILLVRFALERLLFRMSKSAYRDRYILKGGMLVTQWLDHGNRETRDIDFLGYGDAKVEAIEAIFTEIMKIAGDDGLEFDTGALVATAIREEMVQGGIRLRTAVYFERTRIPLTIDIGFGDALADAPQSIAYPSLLGIEQPVIRSYPPEAVIAEKYQAVVALGLANGRMKDFDDLRAVPKMQILRDDALDAAIRATFTRRGTAIPDDRPAGLSEAMAQDAAARQRWRAYSQTLDLPQLELQQVLDKISASLPASCARLGGDQPNRA
jgi:Nucleotidyl transferase AbiEii toxin, Type IV TA system